MTSKLWNDTTKNPKTGHYVALDVMKAVCFMTGIPLLVFAAVAKFFLLALVIYADYSDRFINVEVPIMPGVTLVCLGLGAYGPQILKTYLNRLTTDSNGNPLSTPATAEDAPPYGPQVFPTPAGEDAGLADAPLPPTR